MTTIAYKQGIMACDSQATAGDTIVSYKQKKIYKVNGHLIGCAGRLSECIAFVDYFRKLMVVQEARQNGVPMDSLPPFEAENFMAIVVDPEREVSIFEGGNDIIPAEDPVAIGSGGVYATAAMKAGADAKRAVEIAIEMDVFSGGDVQVVEVDRYLEELEIDELVDIAKSEGLKPTKKMSKEDLITLIMGSDD